MDAAALLEKAHDVLNARQLIGEPYGGQLVAVAALLVARSIARTRARRAVALAKVR